MNHRRSDAEAEAPVPSYEEAISRLEGIVRNLESGQLSLEEALGLFQEGVGLTKLCERMLDDTEAKIEVLTRKDGVLVVQPFEAGEIVG